jgi:sugar phosphate isomerase/epimerase
VKLAFSSNAFRSRTLEDTIATLAGIGYEGIEIMADAPHGWPPDVTPPKIDSIRRALNLHRLEVSNVNAFMMCAYRDPRTGRAGTFHWPSWIDRDELTREARVRHTIACVDLAASVGARTVSTEPGGLLDGREWEEGCRLFAEGLSRAARRARERGVEVLVEPEPGLLLQRSGEYVDFVSRFADFGGVGLNFDMGHFFCVGEDPAALIRQVGRQARHFHLEDIAADRAHFHLPPGEGVMEYAAIFGALREIGYDDYLTGEFGVYRHAPEVMLRHTSTAMDAILKM